MTAVLQEKPVQDSTTMVDIMSVLKATPSGDTIYRVRCTQVQTGSPSPVRSGLLILGMVNNSLSS
jgi:hypothetical protein